ncbi:hypothetical protein RPMA_11535 [Tardiphaga alba]|uniref:Uncharacterized protein n=1 Tax=Tardiphaga alba TaxID=340268 RepID=A0ABX8A6W0_9BRAD|nr:hypothetical protein [Tardiphaga alba]QUS39399.1 hypothetical protein RPMA_11535 [Tardiphaga alba]
MKTQQPIIREDDEHRVLRFVPRTSETLPQHPTAPESRTALNPAGDLSRYTASANEPDDFRHRMLANSAAVAFTALLVGAGIWLAITIADLRKTQDCVLMGRRDCARIATPHI